MSFNFWRVNHFRKWVSRWWFQIFFMFTPIRGRFPFWLIFFFQLGWFNHHLGVICHPFTTAVYCLYLSLSKCCIGLVRLKVTDLQEPLLRELKAASYFEWRPSTGNWEIWKQTLVEAPAGGNHLTVELMNGGLTVCWVYWKRMIFIAMFSLPQCTGGLHYALFAAADIVLLPIDSLACRSWTGRVEICDECNSESCEAKGRGVDCPVYSHKAGWCKAKLV